MKCLIKKSTGEYVHIWDNKIYTCSQPDILPDTASIERIKEIQELKDEDFSDIELIEVYIIKEFPTEQQINRLSKDFMHEITPISPVRKEHAYEYFKSGFNSAINIIKNLPQNKRRDG